MMSFEEFQQLSPAELDDYVFHLDLIQLRHEEDMRFFGVEEYHPQCLPLNHSVDQALCCTNLPKLPLLDDEGANDELLVSINSSDKWAEEAEEVARESKPPAGLFAATTLESLLKKNLPPREYVLDPIIPERGLAMLFASRGVGKTHVGLGIAYAVASGGSFLRWKAPKPRKVLYIDGEMPEVLLQERSKYLKYSSAKKLPDDSYFTFLSMDCQSLGTTINLADPAHQYSVDCLLKGFEFVVIDNISTLVSGGRENDAASWDKMQAWLLQLRRRGITVLLIHHTGRGENARGTSKREDVLDTVMLLKRPNNYKMSEGARFEVHLTKARGISGPEAEPFEAHLITTESQSLWRYKVLGDDEYNERVIALTKEGRSVRDIGSSLGLSKSSVHRLQAELREKGLL